MTSSEKLRNSETRALEGHMNSETLNRVSIHRGGVLVALKAEGLRIYSINRV
jgi:hypothetical protein